METLNQRLENCELNSSEESLDFYEHRSKDDAAPAETDLEALPGNIIVNDDDDDDDSTSDND